MGLWNFPLQNRHVCFGKVLAFLCIEGKMLTRYGKYSSSPYIDLLLYCPRLLETCFADHILKVVSLF